MKKRISDLLKSRQIRNFIIYGFGQAVNLISPLLVLPYIVSLCGEEGLGKVGVGFSFALISIVLVDYGSYINGTKQVSIHSSNTVILEEKFTSVYISKFILLLIVLLLCSLVICTVPFFAHDKFQLFMSLFIVVGQFINPTWFFQGIQNFKWISAINVISKAVYISLVFLFIKKPEDYVYINAFLGFGSIIASLSGFLWLYSHYSFSFKNASLLKVKSIIKEEFSLTISQLFFSFYQYAPIILISYVCGNFMAGQYRIIDQVIMIFRTYLQMFFNFIYAEICLQIYENATEGLKKWKKVNGCNYIMILIILLVFFFNSERILLFFKINPNDINILKVYFKIGLMIPVFMSISFALKQLMFSFDKNRYYIFITVTSTILNILIMYFLLTTIGLKGAFLSTIFVEIFIIIFYLIVLGKNLSLTTNKECQIK